MRGVAPFCDPYERMSLAEFEHEDAVSEVMPVDDDFTSSQPPNEPYERESRNAWWVLTYSTIYTMNKLIRE